MVQDIDTLYLFGFSGMTKNHLERILPIIKTLLSKRNKIGLVLIHDGVIGISTKGRIPKDMEDLLNLNVTLFAMIPDLKARGIPLEFIHERIKPIEYDELVDILDEAPKVISWM